MPSASLDDVRDAFSVALRSIPPTRSAWMSSDEEGYHLWLLIEPSDMVRERTFYAVADPLYKAFPTTAFIVHVLNPRTYPETDPERMVPASALLIGGYTPA
jgi:hypothetical protein